MCVCECVCVFCVWGGCVWVCVCLCVRLPLLFGTWRANIRVWSSQRLSVWLVLWPVLVHLKVIVYQLAVQCKAQWCYESQSRQLKNRGDKIFPCFVQIDRRYAPLCTAFGSDRITTKLLPTPPLNIPRPTPGCWST